MSKENSIIKCPKCKAPVEKTWEICPRCCTILPDLTVQKEQPESFERCPKSSTTEEKASPAVRENENLKKLHEAIAFQAGTGRKIDYVKAKELFLELAELDYPLAKIWIAQCCHKGYGNFQKDVKKAEKIAKEVVEQVKELAKQGDQDAVFLLGRAYWDGLGLDRDYEKAVDWYRKAAEAGNSEAMNNLGISYRDGKGVPQNNEKAAEWFSKAAKAGNSWALKELEASYLSKRRKKRKYKFSGEHVFFIDDKTILENVRLLITNYEIEEADAIEQIGRQLADKPESFVIIAPKFKDSVLQEIKRVFENIEHRYIGAACFSVGESDLETLQDIAVVTGGNLIAEELGMSLKNITVSEFGAAKKIYIDATCLEITGGKGKTNAVQGLAKSVMYKIKDTAVHERKVELIHRYENLTGQPVREWPAYEPCQERNLDGWRLPYGYASAHFCNGFEPLKVELSQCRVLATTHSVCVSVGSPETSISEGGIMYPEVFKVANTEDAEDSIVPLLEQVSNESLPLLLIAPCVNKEALAMLVVNKLRGNFYCAAINTCGDTQVIEKMQKELEIKVIDKTRKLSNVSPAELSVVKKVIILDDLSIFQL